MTCRLALALLVCIASPGFAQTEGRRGDVLLVAHPDRLIAYTRYQQRLSSGEMGALVPFAPMIVVREDDRLGDGFTPCVRVELSTGETMYFQRLSREGLAASLGAAGAILHRNVVLYGDTVVFRQSVSFRLQSRDTSTMEVIPQDTPALRMYEYEGETYIRTLHGSPGFGWVVLLSSGLGTAWELRRLITPGSSPSLHSLMGQIQTTTGRANRALERIYRRLRDETGKHIVTPSFDVSESDVRIQCRLHPPSQAKDLSGSLRALAAELTGAFPGTDVITDESAGLITITRR